MPGSGTYRLRCLHGCLAGTTRSIGEGATVVGRASPRRIFVPGTGISRWHARFLLRDGRLTVEDCGSRVGTYVNGRAILRPVRLVPGDQVALGQHEFLILAGAPSEPTRAAVSSNTTAANTGCRFTRSDPPRAREHSVFGSLLPGAAVVMPALVMLALTGWSRLAAVDVTCGGLVPAGWVVQSRFVEVAPDRTTNLVVLVFRPGEDVP